MPREIARLFAKLKPDVVVTWGPDGITGHADHMLDGMERLVEGGAVHRPPWFGPAESTTDLFE